MRRKGTNRPTEAALVFTDDVGTEAVERYD